MRIVIKIYRCPPGVRIIITKLRVRTRKCSKFLLVTGVALTIFKLYQSGIRTFMLGMAAITRSSLVNGGFFTGKCVAVEALARHPRSRSWIKYRANHCEWPVTMIGVTIIATIISDNARVLR
jgi:hypothetical protein